MPCIYVLNKIDAISLEELEVMDKIPHYVPIAGMLGWNFDELLESIWDYQDLIRIYTKPKVYPCTNSRVKFQTTTRQSY